MKNKIILFLLVIFISYYKTDAQIYVTTTGIYSFPLNDFGNLTNYGTGADLGIGFTTKSQLDINLSFSYSFINSLIGSNHSLTGGILFFKYYFTKTNIQPYIGIGLGQYLMKYNEFINNDLQKYTGTGFEAEVGILSRIKFSKNLFLKTSLSYLKAMKNPNVETLNFKLGLLYYIKGNQ